jgi:hypothetical protein
MTDLSIPSTAMSLELSDPRDLQHRTCIFLMYGITLPEGCSKAVLLFVVLRKKAKRTSPRA